MYLGAKGYTIPKKALSPKQLDELRKNLTLSPKVKFGIAPKGTEIPVYRENAEKIYIPRFYGIEKYGLPSTSKLAKGTDIDVPFGSELRDYQIKIVDIYLQHVKQEQGNGAILEVPCGRGKTIMALNICSQLKKKTIILVHKEFLMNQWIDRIQEFMPTARVGVIQGDKYDVEGKDIVIGMIQTLYTRDYCYDSFGLTIIDEVHRIGSEEFSKTLLKIVTPYMLGISATVDRKDGLTDILYMFVGPKIYTEERSSEVGVDVRAIQYEHPNDDFNQMEYDFRGNVKYSTMVSKISDFTPRSEFLVRVIKDLLEENENQIMVLSLKRDLLTFLHEQIIEQKIGTVGFYVGGMKPGDLLETESRQIVLATYSMAAEALDIKSLNTLVMVSPKTDVIQSVGRILRTNCAGKIIVDIVDSHEVFQNQWKKRRVFYKKSNYQIRFIKSANYLKDHSEKNWKTVKENLLPALHGVFLSETVDEDRELAFRRL